MRFLGKCTVAASIKNNLYDVYVHLCQDKGELLYETCKAGACS